MTSQPDTNGNDLPRADPGDHNKDNNRDKDKQHLTEEEQEEEEAVALANLVPPITSSESFRDALLRCLDTPMMQYIGIFVLVLVIIDGAFFFFLLVGWHGMCKTPSRTDCDPRNWWLNFSIQLLNVLFTYMNIVSMPWRSAQFLHIAGWSCPHRSNEIGCNIYGIPNDPDIWCYIPLRQRLWITVILINNCITQYINQVTRIIYPDFESSNSFPGTLWTNLFFALSFACGGVGAGWMLYEMGKVRAAYPGKFGPGPIDSIKLLLEERKKAKEQPPEQEKEKVETNAKEDDDEESHGGGSAILSTTPATKSARHHPDPTRAKSRRAVIGQGESRASARLFGM